MFNYNLLPTKVNILSFLKHLKSFRGTKQELQEEFKNFFKRDIQLLKRIEPIILDDSFLFTFENDLFCVDVTYYFIYDLKGNYYLTEFECQFL